MKRVIPYRCFDIGALRIPSSHNMRFFFALSALGIVLLVSRPVSGLGSSCSAPLGNGTASPSDPYWMETIKHQGTSAFNPNPSTYQVFRNVKNFGAEGDGVTDDTAAIKLVITNGFSWIATSCAFQFSNDFWWALWWKHMFFIHVCLSIFSAGY